MTPDQLAKAQTEHAHQAAFFCALRDYQSQYPQLGFCFAIPNGGERNVAVASRLKAEGVKSGVPDVFLPYPCGQYHGLWIEFKRPKVAAKAAGKLSREQISYSEYLISQKYFHFVAYDYLSAVDTVLRYIRCEV
jgi:VRR-NUC domain